MRKGELLGRHTSVPSEAVGMVEWLRSQPWADRCILGIIEACRHRFTPGKWKFQREEKTGLVFKVFLSGAVMRTTLIVNDRAAALAAMSKRMETL